MAKIKKVEKKQYTVTSKQTFYVFSIVTASSEEEARDLVLSGMAEHEEVGEFCETANPPREWKVTLDD